LFIIGDQLGASRRLSNNKILMGVDILGLRQQWLAIAFASAFAAACGGGSSSAAVPQPSGSGTPTNAAPTFTSAATASVLEGALSVLDIVTSDSDGETVTLALSGADASLFTLTGNALSFNTAPDFETPGSAATSNAYSLILSASDGTDTATQNLAVSVTDATEGRVIDGPLAGAKIFIDLNGNLVQDANEPSVISDADGTFKLPVVEAAEGQTIKLVSIGGTDTSTGKELPDMALVSDVPVDANPVSITPISTILAAATAPADKKAILTSLGISGSVDDFLKKDVWALAQGGDEEAKNMQRANLAISAILQTATSLVDTSDPATAVANATNVINALAQQIVTQSVAGADVFDAAVLSTILEQGVNAYAAVNEPALVITTAVFNAVSRSVSTLVVIIEGTEDPTNADAAAISSTVQGSLQTAIQAVALSGDTATFDTASSTTTLFVGASAAVAAIVSLDTDGDGIINTLDPDIDNDGVLNADDKFPLDRNESLDTDNDGIGNRADTDDDGDGVPDALDAFRLDPTRSTLANGASVLGLALPQVINVLETTE
jgi:hypothetical protein